MSTPDPLNFPSFGDSAEAPISIPPDDPITDPDAPVPGPPPANGSNLISSPAHFQMTEPLAINEPISVQSGGYAASNGTANGSALYLNSGRVELVAGDVYGAGLRTDGNWLHLTSNNGTANATTRLSITDNLFSFTSNNSGFNWAGGLLTSYTELPANLTGNLTYLTKGYADSKYAPIGGSSSSVTSFNNRTGNVFLTSSDVTSALAYTPLTSTTSYSNLSFTGTSDNNSFSLKASNSNGSQSIVLSSTGNNYTYGNGTIVPWGTYQDILLSTNNPRANGQVDTHYPFIRLYSDRSFPDLAANEAYVALQYNYTPNATAGPYYNSGIKVFRTRAEFFASSYTWTDSSLITRLYADSRYLTTSNLSTYLTISSAAATYLPTANFTYANLTGKPTLANVATSGSYTDLSNTPASYSLPTASTTVLGGVKVDGSSITITGGVISSANSYTLPAASVSVLGGVKIGSGVSVDANGFLTVSTSYAGLGSNTFTGTQALGGNLLTQPKLQAYRETSTSPAISSGTLTLDLSTSNFFAVSLNAAITTLTISNTPASSAASFTLELTADGTARAVTWGSAIKWSGGTAPTLTSTSGKKDVFAFYSTDGGTSWQGFTGGQNF